MKPVTHLFRELVRDFSSERWNEDDLAKLSGAELEALTKLVLVLLPALSLRNCSPACASTSALQTRPLH
jgi:hypothetical protein